VKITELVKNHSKVLIYLVDEGILMLKKELVNRVNELEIELRKYEDLKINVDIQNGCCIVQSNKQYPNAPIFQILEHSENNGKTSATFCIL